LASSTKTATFDRTNSGTTGFTNGLRLALIGGGEEDDRRVARLVPLPDERGRLEAVHLGHLDVEQHDRELVGEEPLQRLAPGAGLDEILAEALEHRLERDQVGRLVVDQQDVDAVGWIVGLTAAGAGLALRRRDPGRCLGQRPELSLQLAVRPANHPSARHRYSHTRRSESSWSMSTGLAM
jgi:hypothetical protein